MPGWQGIDLGAQLETRFKLPVVVENDGQAATIGEALHGAGRGHSHVLGVTVGTGIGGGFAVEGQVYAGATRASLGVGHILVMRDGRRCPCGRLGCLEAYASGPALALEYRARREVRAGKTHLPDGDTFNGDAVWHAAQAGDADAIAAIRACGGWLGFGLATAYNLFNPSVTVVGGGVAQIGDLFLDAARESLALHAYPTVRQAPIVAAALGPRAGLIGAAALIRARLNHSS
jgi:glucokinase